MNRLYIVLILFLVSLSIWAEEDVFRHPLVPHNMDAFNATSRALAQYPIVRGNFEQEKILSRLNRSLKSSGNFIIAAELGMVWDTLKPFPSTMALGNDYIVQSRPGGQKTVLMAQGNETFTRLAEVISSVFTGNTRKLLDNFEVYYLSALTSSAANWELGLLPRDKAVSSFAASILMKGDTVIRSIYINEQNGDAISYVLSNHSYPSELAQHEKSFFTIP